MNLFRAAHLRGRRLAIGAGALLLAGCASVDFEESVRQTNQDAAGFTQGRLALAGTPAQREVMAREADALLAQPLGQDEAVRLALLNSPALQALLANNWSEAATAAQGARIANPVFTFERMRSPDEVEFGRMLAFGLLDLITLPHRYGVARRQIAQAQLRLTTEVVDQVTRIRQTWVNAVAAQQKQSYAEQVYEAADAGAELAQRLQAVGNITRLQRARHQAFYADAATQLAGARHAALAAREALVRQLGLTDAQAARLQLPGQLPPLPAAPRTAGQVAQATTEQRLDVRQARLGFDAAAKAQGLTAVTSLTDIELGVRRDQTFDKAEGHTERARGYEIEVRLPLFDWGGMQRDSMNARTLAAANALEATLRAAGSELRESYSAYRTGYDIARHYRDEVLPLSKAISEENTLRYNGMLIGVFELLADSREQIGAVVNAINAQQQFWLADAALQAAVLGKPTAVAVGLAAAPGAAEAGH
ncbi:TolC family protein [Chitiniphilus purpureus]|uniref:TolC family protein n=1 Tax=Chitiniphilus purpureus TaxID=2981137 RepID=A0ABY6DKS0_9NEIS|nr:TolC family protein [Chitiniphilus sp. CD1]UXY14956.1 TolC family protein [Chitiniphilus sp. CD1]